MVKPMKTTEIVNLIKGHLVKEEMYKVDSSDNPLKILTNEMRLALYVRKITSAYFKDRADVSRIQLHDSNSIKSLENKGFHVLVVGYCPKTETVVLWPPLGITSRFNKRKNVSLYSRFSFQAMASKSATIQSFKLANGDVIRSSHVSAIAKTLAFVTSQIMPKITHLDSGKGLHHKTSSVTALTDSNALKKIFEDNPHFTFADAVDCLRSNRKPF